jgi:hypothetical protein
MRLSRVVCLLFAVPLLAGCPKLAGSNAADGGDDAGATAAVAPSASAVPSASASAKPVHADVKRDAHGCKPGESYIKVYDSPKGPGTFSMACHHVCEAEKDCPKGQSCSGSASSDVMFCQASTPEFKPPTCKAGEKLVNMASAVDMHCIKPCTADSDCKEKYATCDLKGSVSNWSEPSATYHICIVEEIDAPKGQPMQFPNPKNMKCPFPYTNMDDSAGHNCFMKPPKT